MVVQRSTLDNELAKLVSVGSLRWRDLDVTPSDFLDACARNDVTGLVHARLNVVGADTVERDRRLDVEQRIGSGRGFQGQAVVHCLRPNLFL